MLKSFLQTYNLNGKDVAMKWFVELPEDQRNSLLNDARSVLGDIVTAWLNVSKWIALMATISNGEVSVSCPDCNGNCVKLEPSDFITDLVFCLECGKVTNTKKD